MQKYSHFPWVGLKFSLVQLQIIIALLLLIVFFEISTICILSYYEYLTQVMLESLDERYSTLSNSYNEVHSNFLKLVEDHNKTRPKYSGDAGKANLMIYGGLFIGFLRLLVIMK